MPKQSEVAELTVDGKIYKDWESVSVTRTMRMTPPHYFRFTCSEALPLDKNWAVMQIRPGADCTVKLAGQAVITGTVSTRQVFYDAFRHHIEIQGEGSIQAIGTAPAVVKGMETKDKNFQQNADLLLKPHGKTLKVVGGTLSKLKFPRLSIVPTESIYEVLDKMSRYVNVDLGSDTEGNVVAFAGPTGGGIMLVEGEDILEGREIIYNKQLLKIVQQSGAIPGTDDKHGAEAASEPFHSLPGAGMFAQAAPQLMVGEYPAWTKEHMKARGDTELSWMQRDAVTLQITVLGWLKKGGGGVWVENEKVKVKSPMLLMDGSRELTTKSVTYSQDNRSGSRTVLELVNDKALGEGVQQDTGSGIK